MAADTPRFEPSLEELREAHAASRALVRETPTMTLRSLSREIGGEIVLKAENLQRTGSFKLRGALAKLRGVDPAGCKGVVAGSAGNHAQSLAYAARAAELPCRVYMPTAAAISKVDAVEAFGGEVVRGGVSVDECVGLAREAAAAEGLLFVHPFDDPEVIRGQAGVGLELSEQVSDLRRVVVPVGGGGLASGLAMAVKLARPEVQVIGVQAAGLHIEKFPNDNIFVRLNESVREQDVFLIQSLHAPLSDRIMELLLTIDACKRDSAGRITAVLPYYAYSRTDKRDQPRVPISARLLADMLEVAGADRVLTLDLHAGQIQGFFDIPTDNLFASPVMVRDIKERFDLASLMVVSPDVGGVVRARGLAKRINAPLAIIDKRRERAGESEVMNVIGEVAGHVCILVDDIVDSGGTLVNAADALLGQGATEVYAYITHGVLSGGAVARVTSSRLKELVITDSIQPTKAVRDASNIRVLPIAQLIGEAIGRTAHEESVSSLFD